MAVLDKAGLAYFWGKLKGTFLSKSGGGVSGKFEVAANAGLLNSPDARGQVMLTAYGANDEAFITFHNSSHYAVNLGLSRADNKLYVGGFSAGANKYKVCTQQTIAEMLAEQGIQSGAYSKIIGGRVTISTPANTETTVGIAFPNAGFTQVPSVLVTLNSDMPQVRFAGVGVDTVVGATVHVYSNVATSYFVNWIAIGV